MNIELDEAPDGSQKPVEGKLFVYCDCAFGEPCPNGRVLVGMAARCCVRLEKRRLSAEQIELLENQQR